MDLKTIRERIRMIEDLEEENRISKELIDGALENSSDYEESNESAKEAGKIKKKIKDQIMAEEANKNALEDVKINREEIKTLKEILSAELAEFYTKNKTDEIRDASGQTRKFKITIRLLPKGKNENRDSYGRYSKDSE